MAKNEIQKDTKSVQGRLAGLAFQWQRTPGIWLGGRRADPPADFATINADRVAWVETRARLPYVVALGYLGVGKAVYLMALPHSTWYARLRGNPDVRLRIRSSVYAMRASDVDDDEELRHVIDLYNEKYEEWVAQYYDSPYTFENIRDRVVPLRLTPR